METAINILNQHRGGQHKTFILLAATLPCLLNGLFWQPMTSSDSLSLNRKKNPTTFSPSKKGWTAVLGVVVVLISHRLPLKFKPRNPSQLLLFSFCSTHIFGSVCVLPPPRQAGRPKCRKWDLLRLPTLQFPMGCGCIHVTFSMQSEHTNYVSGQGGKE